MSHPMPQPGSAGPDSRASTRRPLRPLRPLLRLLTRWPWRPAEVPHPLQRWRAGAAACVLLLLLAAVTGPAQALYKVVQSDGSVTYTDRPPVTSNARITQLNRNALPTSPEASLPPELRQAATRYPVTLYTGQDCTPCDAARRLLQQRGIPYSERRVSTDEDASALDRLVGGRTVPSLTIGAQPLRGFSEADWTSFLDVAGYPRTNRLPRGWPVAEPAPLVDRGPPLAVPLPAPAPPRSAPQADPSPQAAPGSLRF